MEERNIVIHQAYYGEFNKAHSCINQTIKNSDLTSFLIAFTDRPAALPPNIGLTPYLSGATFSEFYIFTKTFPDQLATRAGMVFTHVLILKIDDILYISSLDDILSHFVDGVPEFKEQLEPINVYISDKQIVELGKMLPKFIQQSIATYLEGTFPILFSGNINSFNEVLQQIWNALNGNLKKEIKFRTSFTPADISETNDLTIVFIQKDFLPKWNGRIVISDESNELVEITSHSEALFLGYKDENPFYSFLVELNINQSEFSIFGQCSKLYNAYLTLDKIVNPNEIRSHIRLLTTISPSSSDGKFIKDEFFEKFEELIHTGKDRNLKALRNIEWKAFSYGESRVKAIITYILNVEFRNSENFLTNNIYDVIKVSISEESKDIWHIGVKESFKNICSHCEQIVLQNLWKLINLSTDILDYIFSLIPDTNESYLRNTIPADLSQDTSNTLAEILIKKEWYLFHSVLLLKKLPINELIKKHLTLESALDLEKSFGIKFLIAKINNIDLLNLTLATCDEKLIKLIVERILKDKTILSSLDVRVGCWHAIWGLSLEKTRNISNGIEGKEQGVIHSVLDLIVEGNPIQEIIVELIANSAFADLISYPKRNEIWNKIPKKFIDRFLGTTSQTVLKSFMADQISFETIEKELIEKITSDSFMSSFLNTYQNDIDSVVKVYGIFPNLKDEFLSGFIQHYKNSISHNQAQELGILANHLSFEKTAKSISEKSKYNYSFKPAFDECKNLVPSISFFNILLGNGEKSKKHKITNVNLSRESMEESLPIIVILTAIQDEYMAVRKHLTNIADADKSGTVYEKGVFKFEDTDIAEVIIRECGAKNNIAAQEAERAISNFCPQMILFVGIAGSRKPNDFKIGDVIFPDKIYYYEGGKADNESYKARPESVSPTFELIEKAKKERNKEDWKYLIKGNYLTEPKANLGIIASGEQLIDHHNSEVGKILLDHYNETSAVEMEGYGFAKSATRQGLASSNMIMGVVRGISDIIEQSQQNQELNNNDKRPDNAKQFASDTASAFAFWLIFKTYGKSN